MRSPSANFVSDEARSGIHSAEPLPSWTMRRSPASADLAWRKRQIVTPITVSAETNVEVIVGVTTRYLRLAAARLETGRFLELSMYLVSHNFLNVSSC